MPYVNDRMYDAMLAENVNLRARVAELEQALAAATAWEPVSDGMVYHYTDSIAAEWNYPAHTESIEFLEVRDNGATIACGSTPDEDEYAVNPPDDVRLCRRVVTPANADMEDDDGS